MQYQDLDLKYLEVCSIMIVSKQFFAMEIVINIFIFSKEVDVGVFSLFY